MKNIRRSLTALVVFVAILSQSACTPEQIATYTNLTGLSVTSEREAMLLALPDSQMIVGSKVINTDGSFDESPQAIVNSATYNWGDPGPAMQAFRLVTSARGWSAQQTASWEVAANDIMKGESGYCPNLLRGARIGSTTGCVLSRQGRNSDAGFGQLIGIHHTVTRAGTGWLCIQEGICGKWSVIATPWNSMTSLVALIERSGVSGWCYSSSARRHHRSTCNNPGLDV